MPPKQESKTMIYTVLILGLLGGVGYSFLQLQAHSQNKSQNTSCDSSYPDVCIPPPPPDLNCSDITERQFRVVGSDPHGFDKNKDGVGCEQ